LKLASFETAQVSRGGLPVGQRRRKLSAKRLPNTQVRQRTLPGKTWGGWPGAKHPPGTHVSGRPAPGQPQANDENK